MSCWPHWAAPVPALETCEELEPGGRSKRLAKVPPRAEKRRRRRWSVISPT